MIKMLKGLFGIGAAVLLLPSTLFAQDTQPSSDIGTSTPPELRDFRLDPPQPRSGPPLNPEQVTPSTNSTAVPPEPRPVTTERAESIQTQADPVVRRIESRQGEAATPKVSTTEPLESTPGEKAAELTTPVMASENSGSDSKNMISGASDQRWPVTGIWIGSALAALLILLSAALLWRRQRKATASTRNATAPAQQPSPPARVDKPNPATTSSPAKGESDNFAPNSGPEPIFAEFKPESAQLSIASLSIMGRLTIINRGKIAVESLIMRSHMISAHNGQQEAIATFHKMKGDGSQQPLGSLAAGERIDAVIEIRQPRNELSIFRWTEREFVAPIILINLSGQAGATNVDVQLAQLIGREGDQTSARMKPLPIDRGPKRFVGVSARPLIG